MPPELIPSVAATDLPDDVVLLDVREPDEWAAGHAPGALHVPLGEVPTRFAELPRDADVVVVCHGGGRSARATAWLLEQGYHCRNLTGGMLAYAAAGHPLESDSGTTPTVD
ncbi:MAG TPA: rhodanese-like domain-containing protein [Mycobacteriales bacterium]|jgi:rhodanese-related sulfurtransferase|nr:rhodanese-like domain-containing protein [Mycobacteriales bacterium]